MTDEQLARLAAAAENTLTDGSVVLVADIRALLARLTDAEAALTRVSNTLETVRRLRREEQEEVDKLRERMRREVAEFNAGWECAIAGGSIDDEIEKMQRSATPTRETMNIEFDGEESPAQSQDGQPPP
jgi:hypothetical protein